MLPSVTPDGRDRFISVPSAIRSRPPLTVSASAEVTDRVRSAAYTPSVAGTQTQRRPP